jgi:hypothetical protein
LRACLPSTCNIVSCVTAVYPTADVACVTTCSSGNAGNTAAYLRCVDDTCFPPAPASAPWKPYEYPFASQTLSGEQATVLFSDAPQDLSVNVVGLPDLATTQQGLGIDLTIPAANAINTVNDHVPAKSVYVCTIRKKVT